MADQIDEFCYREMTDEQSFREMVESFVAFRPSSARRKFPRFPTPAALSGALGSNGIDGILVARDPGSSGGQSSNPDCGGCGYGTDVQRIKIDIVDFSESGVQLQLDCSDFLNLKKSSLYLEIENHRAPVQLRWWKQCGSASRAGFLFSNRIDSDQFFASYISARNTQLVEFLMAEYLNLNADFKQQAGVFIYLSIYYGLRLKFLEAIARFNAQTGSNRFEAKPAISITSFGSYASAYHLAQNQAREFGPDLRNALQRYIKPYNDFGSGVIGMNEDVVFMKGETIYVMFNSVLFSNDDGGNSTAILPDLYFLHNNFLTLKHLLMPGVFEDEIFETQFENYSDIIQQIDRSCKMEH